MHYISSGNSTIYKKITSLNLPKYRKKYGLYIVEGINLAREIMEDDTLVRALDSIIVKESGASDAEIMNLIDRLPDIENSRRNGLKLYIAADKLFDNLSDTEHSQGVMAIMRMDAADHDSRRFEAAVVNFPPDARILVLDKLQDPGNAGSIIRTAEAAGFDAVAVIKGTADVYAPKAVRASAGSVLRMPFVYFEDAKAALAGLSACGFHIVAGDMSGLDIDADETDVFLHSSARKLALVIGNEGNGIDEIFRSGADFLMRIPMAGKIESLNAGVAAALMMYRLARKKS